MPRGTWVSPWEYSTADNEGRYVRAACTFDPTTLAIIAPGLSGFRDAGCLYDRVLIGHEPDVKVFLIPEGEFNVGPAGLASQGFSTIDQVAGGFTLGTTETPT